jgi:putative transposase
VIESEVQQLLADHKNLITPEGKAGLVRNGYLPERTIQTELGESKTSTEDLLPWHVVIC